MEYVAFADKVLLPEKRDVLRVHLYFKLIQYGIRPFENDIDIIIELYLFGGYSNSDEQSRFINLCLEKKYKKSEQSIRNTLSKYTTAGLLNKERNTHISIDKKFIPTINFDKLILQHVISHAE